MVRWINTTSGILYPISNVAALLMTAIYIVNATGCASLRKDAISEEVISARQMSLRGFDSLQRAVSDIPKSTEVSATTSPKSFLFVNAAAIESVYDQVIAWYLRFDTNVLQAESHSSTGPIALRMCARGVVGEVVADALQDSFKATKAA